MAIAVMNNSVISNILVLYQALIVMNESFENHMEFPDKGISIVEVEDFFSNFQTTLRKGFL